MFVCSIPYQRMFVDQDVPIDIYRVGQISGDSEHGAWNRSEMMSMMICIGGGELSCMPNQGQDIRWIPVNIAASSIIDIVMQDSMNDDFVHHILNPHALSWSTFLQYLHHVGLQFQTVNTSEWLTTILASQTTLVKLAPFFDGFLSAQDGFQLAEYETMKSETRSSHLHACPSIDDKLISKYLSYWREIGFLVHGYKCS
jgi:thioester reductase-like protein